MRTDAHSVVRSFRKSGRVRQAGRGAPQFSHGRGDLRWASLTLHPPYNDMENRGGKTAVQTFIRPQAVDLGYLEILVI